MKNNNYFLNFGLIFLLYSIITSVVVIFFSEYVSYRGTVLLQIPIFLIPAIYLSKRNNTSYQIKFNIGIKSFIMMLWGLAGLSLFISGWDILYTYVQNFIIPDFLVEFYNNFDRTIIESHNELIINSTGNISEYAIIFFCISVVPAVCEEFLFRGYLLQSLVSANTKKKAVFISAFLFSVIHFNISAIVPIFIMGVYLALITIKTNNLFLPILFHMLNNLLSIIFTNYHAGYNNIIIREEPSNNIWFGIILFLIGICITYLSYKKTAPEVSIK